MLQVEMDILREKISISIRGLKIRRKFDCIFEIHAIEWEQDCS